MVVKTYNSQDYCNNISLRSNRKSVTVLTERALRFHEIERDLRKKRVNSDRTLRAIV